MNIEVFSIYDRCSGTYGTPMFEVNHETAKRHYDYLMKNAEMVAQDCDLYFLGSFDNQTGKLTVCEQPEFVTRFQPEV